MTPQPKRRVATVDLPQIIEAQAKIAHSVIYQDPFPEAMNIQAIQGLFPDEVVHVTAKDSDGAIRSLGGAVVSCTQVKLEILNVLTAMYTAPEKEVIRFGTDHRGEPCAMWKGLPCSVRHPNEKTLATIQRIIGEKKHFSVPQDTVREKKQKVKELTPRDVALGFLRVIGSSPKGRGQLCSEAGMGEVPKDLAVQVLQALAVAGKISKFVEHRDGLKVVQWVKSNGN